MVGQRELIFWTGTIAFEKMRLATSSHGDTEGKNILTRSHGATETRRGRKRTFELAIDTRTNSV